MRPLVDGMMSLMLIYIDAMVCHGVGVLHKVVHVFMHKSTSAFKSFSVANSLQKMFGAVSATHSLVNKGFHTFV